MPARLWRIIPVGPRRIAGRSAVAVKRTPQWPWRRPRCGRRGWVLGTRVGCRHHRGGGMPGIGGRSRPPGPGSYGSVRAARRCRPTVNGAWTRRVDDLHARGAGTSRHREARRFAPGSGHHHYFGMQCACVTLSLTHRAYTESAGLSLGTIAFARRERGYGPARSFPHAGGLHEHPRETPCGFPRRRSVARVPACLVPAEGR